MEDFEVTEYALSGVLSDRYAERQRKRRWRRRILYGYLGLFLLIALSGHVPTIKSILDVLNRDGLFAVAMLSLVLLYIGFLLNPVMEDRLQTMQENQRIYATLLHLLKAQGVDIGPKTVQAGASTPSPN